MGQHFGTAWGHGTDSCHGKDCDILGNGTTGAHGGQCERPTFAFFLPKQRL